MINTKNDLKLMIGSAIADDAIVGANAIVTRVFNKNIVLAGVPAKKISINGRASSRESI